MFPYCLDPLLDLLKGSSIRAVDHERVRKALFDFVRHFLDTSMQVRKASHGVFSKKFVLEQ